MSSFLDESVLKERPQDQFHMGKSLSIDSEKEISNIATETFENNSSSDDSNDLLVSSMNLEPYLPYSIRSSRFL